MKLNPFDPELRSALYGRLIEDSVATAEAEEWREIDGYTLYRISSAGRVLSLISGHPKMLSPVADSDGYPTVRLHNKRFKVHRLVCRAFHGPQPPGHQVAHLDGNRGNPAAANLKWCTPKENQSHKALHGTRQIGILNGRAKFSEEKVERARSLAASGYSQRLIAEAIGMSKTQIQRILAGEQRAVSAIRRVSHGAGEHK